MQERREKVVEIYPYSRDPSLIDGHRKDAVLQATRFHIFEQFRNLEDFTGVGKNDGDLNVVDVGAEIT